LPRLISCRVKIVEQIRLKLQIIASSSSPVAYKIFTAFLAFTLADLARNF
jgi:hypothetical protein